METSHVVPVKASSSSGKRLLDQVRELIRTLHYSRRTEEAYVDWIRRFILFHGKRHPRDMGKVEIEAFLSYLAVERNVAASTQNQALSALLFLYQRVLDLSVPGLADVVRAKRPQRLPVVLTRAEVQALLAGTEGAPGLAACRTMQVLLRPGCVGQKTLRCRQI